ncbi:MAG: FtsX-like permease family protein [Acidobacteria bacterium]|nr:FtsX-like permease family protein [Acidobacteriota bacterium]
MRTPRPKGIGPDAVPPLGGLAPTTPFFPGLTPWAVLFRPLRGSPLSESQLGAGGRRLARQFFFESLVLTLSAGTAGVGLAFGCLRALQRIAPADIPRLGELTIDLRVLAATSVVTTLVGLGFGMVPTPQIRRFDLQSALRRTGGRQASADPRHSRLRSVLVVAELALTAILVTGA